MARVGLDRDRIVATALDLVDDVGLEGLSTRALAQRLGVQSPALYWHFRSRADVVAAMAESMVSALPDAALSRAALGSRPSRKAVAEWLVSRAQLFRQVLLSRRDGARIHAGSRPVAAQYAGVEAQLDALHRLGFDATAAARVTVAISRFVVGWVLEEQSGHRVGDDAPLDAGQFPLVAAAFVGFDRDEPDVAFTACLTAVVDGLLRHR